MFLDQLFRLFAWLVEAFIVLVLLLVVAIRNRLVVPRLRADGNHHRPCRDLVLCQRDKERAIERARISSGMPIQGSRRLCYDPSYPVLLMELP